MLKKIFKNIFGSINDRKLTALEPIVKKINDCEEDTTKLSDKDLKQKTNEFKKRLAQGETLDDILPEAYAVVREAAKRVLGERHFDVQLMGGVALHKGMLAEMKTGEGKTLVSTLPIYLNALSGKGVHVVTVNDYLAERDSEWMGQIYRFLGMTVGCISNVEDEEKKASYSCDITYGTNNEFGFDYLRDNMKFDLEEMVQRPFNFAIIDEVDSVLIDEARTPLVISGPAESDTAVYHLIEKHIKKFKPADYEIDEKSKNITLSEQGVLNAEKIFIKDGVIKENSSLYDVENITILHHLNQALRAHKLMKKDIDYLVKDHQVMIIDEFTGRVMEGRRFSEGLHQALEAKENVPIQNENQTLASITFQNYFRLYPKLAGMTGTALTEAGEFKDIYNLDVVAIPTNQKVSRRDEDDAIYRTEKEKIDAIIEEIISSQKKEQPVLVGTISIEKSEFLSKYLKKRGIKHKVLNAKYHEQEAYIISQAGQPGAVTIATNMAGRGTDIKLGGNAEMLIAEKERKGEKFDKEKTFQDAQKDKKASFEAGGLYVIGTERHESRRIDNQLRGRSGRMGDPGRTKFYLSLEDDLMRIFASEKLSGILKTLGLKKGEAIHHPMISRAIERAQKKVESRNYEMRKNLLKFDDVMNDQRKVIYEQRHEIISSENVHDMVENMIEDVNLDIVNNFIKDNSFREDWNLQGLEARIHMVYNPTFKIKEQIQKSDLNKIQIIELLNKKAGDLLKLKQKEFGQKLFFAAEQKILLFTLDQLWKDHLLSLDHLKQGIYLRAYGQKDPLNEYKKEAFILFSDMLDRLKELYISRITKMEVDPDHKDEDTLNKSLESKQRMHTSKTYISGEQDLDSGTLRKRNVSRDSADPASWGRVGRNEFCPCGSGKKFKQCHGKFQ
ncbi:MAG: preprotein translocase subunit SecA [Rickettsiales bacterium]